MENNKVTLTFILTDPSKPFEFRGKTYTSKTGFFGVEVGEEEADSIIEESRKTSEYDLVKDSRNRFDPAIIQMFKEKFKKSDGE